MVRANELVVDLTHDIADIHKFIRDIYSKRFPELESLVLHPLDYARTVLLLGNELGKVNDLADVLPATNVITISMTASSSTGKLLDKDELDRVYEASKVSLDLDGSRQKILSYVEGRMKVFAPNLSGIVGSEIAAKLIGAAGGLNNLANMPSTTLFVLGKKKKALDGFSRTTAVKHQGYIMDCDIIRRVPADLETKTCRVLANKCTLAARIDLQHDHYLHGEQGDRFREEIEEKIMKWQMPPPLRKQKVLARPDANEHKTKRGGEKLRRHKEKFHVTELRKRANRVMFGQTQEEYGNTMKTFGMVNQDGSGVLRARVDDDKGFHIKAKKWHKGKRADRTPGIATSIFAMTEVQGMELANPTANKEKIEEEAQSYFSSASSFINVKK
jgi:U4/U6 small nuclear ribonucleoprotein PRP31